MMPDLAAHGGNGIAEGTVSLGVPGSGRGNQRCFGCEVMRPESNQREQAEQCWGGAHNRQIGPLTLSFDAEMGTNFLKGNLQLPTRDEPLEDIDGSGIKIGAEESLWRYFVERIAHQQPADGHRGQTPTVPDSRAGGDLNNTVGAAIPDLGSRPLGTRARAGADNPLNDLAFGLSRPGNSRGCRRQPALVCPEAANPGNGAP